MLHSRQYNAKTRKPTPSLVSTITVITAVVCSLRPTILVTKKPGKKTASDRAAVSRLITEFFADIAIDNGLKHRQRQSAIAQYDIMKLT